MPYTPKPQDSLAVMLLLAILALCFSLAATWDYSDALLAEAMEKQERADKIQEFTGAVLSHPLPYDAVVVQSGAGEPPRARFYLRSGK